MAALELNIIALLIGLATFRISQAIAKDVGPFNIFITLREKISRKYFSNPTNSFWSTLNILVLCPYCLGIWVAALLSWLYSISVHPLRPIEWFLVSLAAAGVQYLTQKGVDNASKSQANTS